MGFIDLTGQKFGRWTVINRAENKVLPSGQKRTMWHCQCDCGNEKDVSADSLKSGQSKSCGCFHKDRIAETTLTDLTGRSFGRWSVIKRGDPHITPSGQSKTMWLCRCECGTERYVDACNLASGTTRSCGCLQKDSITIDLTKRVYDNNGNLIQKLCPCCKKFIDVSLFSKNKRRPDGYNEYCNNCLKYNDKKRYDHYKHGAKSRKLCFDLTIDEFKNITSQPCAYCGEFSVYFNGVGINGIDRIDSSKGYIVNNVIPCCEMCNKMKSNYNVKDWINKIKIISKRAEEGVINVYD